MRRPPPRRGRTHPREHPARAGGLHAEADLNQSRPRGGLLDGHRAVRERRIDLGAETFQDDDDDDEDVDDDNIASTSFVCEKWDTSEAG